MFGSKFVKEVTDLLILQINVDESISLAIGNDDLVLSRHHEFYFIFIFA